MGLGTGCSVSMAEERWGRRGKWAGLGRIHSTLGGRGAVNLRRRAFLCENKGKKDHGELEQRFPIAWGAVVFRGALNRSRFANLLIFAFLAWRALKHDHFLCMPGREKVREALDQLPMEQDRCDRIEQRWVWEKDWDQVVKGFHALLKEFGCCPIGNDEPFEVGLPGIHFYWFQLMWSKWVTFISSTSDFSEAQYRPPVRWQFSPLCYDTLVWSVVIALQVMYCSQ